MRLFIASFLLLTACASGYAPGEYVPIMQSALTEQYMRDVKACYESHRSFVGQRPEYRVSFNECLHARGHKVDVVSTNAKYEALEAARNERLTEKAKKSGGY